MHKSGDEIGRFSFLSNYLPASPIFSAPTVSSQQQAGRAVQDAAGVAAAPSLPRRHLFIDWVLTVSVQSMVEKVNTIQK